MGGCSVICHHGRYAKRILKVVEYYTASHYSKKVCGFCNLQNCLIGDDVMPVESYSECMGMMM